MKRGARMLFKLLLFLLVIGGGAIINVGVTYACARWSYPSSQERGNGYGFGVTEHYVNALCVKREVGWPRRTAEVVRPTFSGSINLLSALWPGFAINTMFYAAVLWVLFAVPGRVRRWRRIKRGQCASCGYSLRDITSEKCPECGATA